MCDKIISNKKYDKLRKLFISKKFYIRGNNNKVDSISA